MKLARNLIAVLIVVSASLAVAQSDARKTFDQLKALEGNWEGKNAQGMPLKVSFRMTADGSALMSEIQGHGQENMVTMFHMDGDRVLATHYCSAGNQPRMKAITSDGKSVTFDFVDGTNLTPGAGHMQRLTLTQADADHHTEEWIFQAPGKEMREVFSLSRAGN